MTTADANYGHSIGAVWMDDEFHAWDLAEDPSRTVAGFEAAARERGLV